MKKSLVLIAVWGLFAAAAIGVGFAAANLVDAPLSVSQAGGPGSTVARGGSPDPSVPVGTVPLETPTADPSGRSSSPAPRGGEGDGREGSDPTRPGPSRSSDSGRDGGTGPSTSQPSTSASPTRSAEPTRSRSPKPRPSRSSSPPPAQTNSINTAGGYVQARCSGGLVSMIASPAAGWRLDERSAGAGPEGEVKFEQDATDSQVKVNARCEARGPVFEVEQESDNDGDDGGGGGE